MKQKQRIFSIVTGVLVCIAITGIFQEQALTFVKTVTTKNLKFLALISEIKLAMSEISHIKLPLIEGSTDNIVKDLSYAENKLLLSNGIVLSQVLLLTLAKSWGLKIVLIVLYALTFWKHTQRLASKLLSMLLMVTPGLVIFTLFIYNFSLHSAIDFGNAYIKKLDASVQTIKDKKQTLIQQHQQQLSMNKNGKSKLGFLGKIKDDVSYDIKRIGNTISGDVTKLRLFIKQSTYQLTQHVINSIVMIIFCFIILPFGYLVLAYTLYKNTFKSDSTIVMQGKEMVSKLTHEI